MTVAMQEQIAGQTPRRTVQVRCAECGGWLEVSGSTTVREIQQMAREHETCGLGGTTVRG